jgi:hypothetical protein
MGPAPYVVLAVKAKILHNKAFPKELVSFY